MSEAPCEAPFDMHWIVKYLPEIKGRIIPSRFPLVECKNVAASGVLQGCLLIVRRLRSS